MNLRVWLSKNNTTLSSDTKIDVSLKGMHTFKMRRGKEDAGVGARLLAE